MCPCPHSKWTASNFSGVCRTGLSLHYGSLAKITDRYEKGYFKVRKEQWGWRDPLDISDKKNPWKVLKDMKKSLGFCACRREAVPGEKSEWRPPNTRIRPDFYFPHFAFQICCCTLWMKKLCGWRWPWRLKLFSSFFAITQTLRFSSQVHFALKQDLHLLSQGSLKSC